MKKCSVIVTTYNRVDALSSVLTALAEQSTSDFEVIIADDGSGPDTVAVIDKAKQQLSIKHVWHQDKGFRAASIRNKAVLAAEADYLIFLDGDSVPAINFVINHLNLAEPGYFVAGHRVLLSQAFTSRVLQASLSIHCYGFWQWFGLGFVGASNKLLVQLPSSLPLLRKLFTQRWHGVKTCNLAVWKADFSAVNGFDEQYTGWGFEDSDLVIRLIRYGVKRKSGRFVVPVFHLWHKENDRSQLVENKLKLESVQSNNQVYAKLGLAQYL